MDQKEEKRIENFFQYFLLILFAGLFLYLIFPFLFAILFSLAIVIATCSYYERILKIVKHKVIASSIMLILISIVFLLPTYFVTIKIYQDTLDFYQNDNDLIENSPALNDCSYTVCSRIQSNLEIFSDIVKDFGKHATAYFENYSFSILTSVSLFTLQVFIFYVCLFYFYFDKKRFISNLKKIIPMKTYYKEALFVNLKLVCTAVFLDSLLIAFMQGALVGLGFYLFGLPSAFVWGLVASFLALLPFLGSGFIWIPGAIYLILIGNYTAGIGLLLWGMIVVSLSDNLVRPLLLQKSINVHPFLILLSIMGGIHVFGFFGIFYGPIIISVLVSLIELYDLDFK